jgi:hypothetical protein
MIYTHEMLEHYISSDSAKEEAYNYVDAGMNTAEIKADIESCLSDYEFECPEDRYTYIDLILHAVETLRKEKNI